MIAPCWIESLEESQSAGGRPRRNEPRVVGSSESLFAEAEFPMFRREGRLTGVNGDGEKKKRFSLLCSLFCVCTSLEQQDLQKESHGTKKKSTGRITLILQPFFFFSLTTTYYKRFFHRHNRQDTAQRDILQSNRDNTHRRRGRLIQQTTSSYPSLPLRHVLLHRATTIASRKTQCQRQDQGSNGPPPPPR